MNTIIKIPKHTQEHLNKCWGMKTNISHYVLIFGNKVEKKTQVKSNSWYIPNNVVLFVNTNAVYVLDCLSYTQFVSF